MLLTLVRISVWRALPQELPASHVWMGVLLLAHVAADVLGMTDALPLRASLDAALLDTSLLAIITGLLLWLRDMSARLPQTLIALAGTSVLLSVPAHLRHRPVPDSLSAVSLAIGLGFVVWFVAMYTHVLKHALSVSTPRALAAAFLYVLSSFTVSAMYLAPTVPEA